MLVHDLHHKQLVISALFFVCLIAGLPCISRQIDSTKNPQYFGIKQHYGFIIPHSKDVEAISQSNPWGFQFEWSKLMIQDNSWYSCNCYAQVGLTLAYFNFANPSVLGNSYNLLFFAEPYLSFKKRLFYSVRAGVGTSYLNKVYDEQTNPTNIFHSSTISFLIFFDVNINYKITEQYTIVATGHYNHISNGGMSHPNKGMNFPTFGVGIGYSASPVQLKPKPRLIDKRGTMDGYIRMFGTTPTVEESDLFPEKKTLLIGLTGGMVKYLTNFNALNIGMELVKDGSFKETAKQLNRDYDHHIVALMVGHNLIFGRFTFNQQIGVYIHKPKHSTSKKMYQRYELLYQISRKINVGTSIKAHQHVAENMDIRFGVVF